MPTVRLSATASIISAVAAGVLLSGCSASVSVEKSSAPRLSADKVATIVAEKLAATTGQAKPDITCPDALEGKVDTTTRCKLTADDGSTLGVTVTVTGVDGNKINFDVKADNTPTPAPS
ncbi:MULTISPECIES: DUF4333 domain-containing protein [unclassified Streptomyces]|uniref:DUF4333 domain-containing protein n=1 Tax=unclassified Streptomyces TaxID=2593676 RepID=UPI003407E29C